MTTNMIFLMEVRVVQVTEGKLFQIMEAKDEVLMVIRIMFHFMVTRMFQRTETVHRM